MQNNPDNKLLLNVSEGGDSVSRTVHFFEIQRHINLLMIDSSSADEIDQLRECLRLIRSLQRQGEPLLVDVIGSAKNIGVAPEVKLGE